MFCFYFSIKTRTQVVGGVSEMLCANLTIREIPQQLFRDVNFVKVSEEDLGIMRYRKAKVLNQKGKLVF